MDSLALCGLNCVRARLKTFHSACMVAVKGLPCRGRVIGRHSDLPRGAHRSKRRYLANCSGSSLPILLKEDVILETNSHATIVHEGTAA